MKSPHTFPNRSLSRRLLSTFLSLAMVLSLLPVWTLPAMADGGAVTYDRKTPEVSILNAYSGRSEKLYSAIKGDGAYAAYNGIGLYTRQSDGAQAKYSDRATGNNEGKAWDFDLGKTAPVLKELVQVSENLQLNTSATFYNRTHSHSHYSWKEVKTYTAEMTVTEKVTSTFSGSTRVIDGWSDKSRTYPRIGDLGGVQSNRSDGFNTIYYKDGNDYCSLRFSHRIFEWTDFEPRTCTCGGSYAENFVVAFRDERAPVCTGASYSVNGGSWVKSTKGVRVGAGQSVRIKLSFNEPIRFADDSAAGKGELYLDLQADGESAGKYHAKLIGLSGNDLIFQYTVPQGQDLEINTLNTSRLFGENLPLKQVGPNGSFSIAGDIKVNGSTLGLSTTTSYITDLAGNAIVRKDLSSANLTLDTTVPYVEKVTFDLALNNADVKEALGKDKWDVNSEQYQRDYTDASDLYLGAGDSLSLTLHMNERVKGIAMTDIEQGRLIHWRHALATTNLKDADGNYVAVRSQFFLPYDNRNSGNTCFVMQPITIGEDWTVDGHDGKIVVTKLELSKDTTSSYGSLDDTVTDLAGNALNKSDVTIAPTANANPPLLDTDAPVVTQIPGSYAKEDDGFRVGVTITDEKSGAADIYGSFTLNNGGDGKAYQYQWAVTAAADTAPSNWSVGVTGVAQQFKQTDPIYFRIRPLSGEHYGDLSGCTVTVNARDYAGNTGAATLPPDGKLEWYIDNLAPTVKFGGTGRQLDSGGTSGTLTAQIVLSDSQGISGWQFAWSDSDTNAPEAWKDGAVSETRDATPVDVSTSVTVNKGELFSKYLWVKAADNSTGQNTSEPVCLGRCSYDLRSAQYQLSDISGIMKTAALEIQSLSDTDALFFLIQAEDDSDYALLRAYGGAANAGHIKDNIFGSENPWDGSCVTYEKNTNAENAWTYSLRNAGTSDAKETLGKLRDGTFSGELTVTILSGKSETVNSQQEGYAWVLGNGTYSFSADTLKLRVAGENVDNYETIAIRCEDALNRLLPTPAGLRFTVSIDKDKNGWGYEDINWQESYVRLVNMLQGQNAEYRLPLGPFQVNADGSTTQTVTVPAGDYPTGRYRVELHMKCTAGKDYLAVLGTDLGSYTPVYVDATRPSDDFTLASVTYNPTASRTVSNPYGLADSENYGTRQWTAEGGVYTLPVSFGYNFASFNYAESAHDVRNLYTIRVTAEKETETTFLDTGYTAGSFSVQLWNTARPDNRISLDATDGAKQTEFTNAVDNYKVGFAFSENDLWKNQELYLAPGVVNTVAVQKVYANGLTSSVKYVQIKPVDDHINGTTTIDAQTRELVFTPEIGANTAGASVYAWAWQNENMNTRSINDETPDDKHYLNGGGVRIDLTAQADGTWRAPLLAGGACYQVITESATGSLRELPTQVYQRAPWFDNCFVYTDDQDYFRYQNDIEIKDNGDGTYTMQFAVRDDGETLKDGLDIDLAMTFKTADSENTHSLSIHYADAATAIRTSSGNSSEVTKDFGSLQKWLPGGAEASGVLSVKLTPYEPFSYGSNPRNAAYKRDVLNVEILAAYPEGYDTMDVSATATDAMGNAGSKTVTGVDIKNKYTAPEPKANASDMVGSLNASADFAVEFNRPVYPADSWAWRAADNKDQPYATKWAQAFPVPGNGAWEIQYLDIFGKLITKTITTDAFTDAKGKDWSIKLNISATEPTTDPVILGLSSEIGYIGVHDSNVHWIYEDGKYLIQDRQVTIDENGRYTAACYEYDETNSEQRAKSSIKIYIDNIVNGAPTAQVHYYVQALGQEFTQSELEQYIAANGAGVEITGNVRAWYSTTRHVTPAEGTGSEFLFTPGGAVSHTFTYTDDFGNTGSVTAALPASLTLQAPPQPPKDTTPPDVDVDIYVKRAGSYTPADAFLGTDDKAVIDGKFAALGYVQGYSLTVKATDESGIERITVAGDGAAITGNVITITAPGTFTVTVTDKAVDPATGASEPNQTPFTFTVPDKIDNTPPTVTVTPVPTSLYSKNLYVTVADTSGAVALMSPAGLDIVPDTTTDKYDQQHKGAYKYVAADNKTVQFTAIDEAGNTGSTSATISGIDTEPPELTVRWSPSDVKDAASPPTGPLNTNVTAHIDSSKAMQNLTVQAGNETTEHTLLADDTAASYTIRGQGGSDLVTITATPERVTVTFKGNYNQTLTFTASAANGKSTVVTLNGVTVIDKVKPEVDQMVVKRYDRKGATVGDTAAAYQVVVALYPSESVTSANYGATKVEDEQLKPVIYGPNAPLKITFTRSGTYTVLLNDQAGNTTTVPVTITGIDRTAPELTVTTVEESNQVKATITVNESCKVTADGTNYTMTANTSQTVTFSKNGTFAITATDAAGNESFKTVRVGSIDNDPPSISFDNSTIYVTEGATEDALKAELDKGYTVWDNVTAKNDLTVTYNSSAVTLNTAGQYAVTYTVTDAAGNKTTANRFVRVIGANTVCVNIDGKLILPDSTAVLRPGAHTLTLQNSDQPYSIKARRGILSAGQMKYLSGSSLHFDADGKFTVSSTGYYTLLVTTQDRQTIRVLLYVEQ